jgi:diaminopimelate epimerase
MPQLEFHKYQGTGNDFIMIDDREPSFDKSRLDLIKTWCNRKFGIGADGVILIKEHDKYDFEMLYFNPDGSQSLCGNGSRCAVKFAKALGLISDQCTFLAVDGPHEGRIEGDRIFVKMQVIEPVIQTGEEYFIDTGSPHHVKMVSNISGVDVKNEGRAIRNSARYQPQGTNVNFVESHGVEVLVHTYERGVEDETLSCGSGVTAVALVMAGKGFESPVHIRTAGGKLQVSFNKLADGCFTEVYLSGPAEKVFEGVLDY